jgi:hypothetical protein
LDRREILAIGGVGGSGTRLFAEAARFAGRRLEGDLNHALDNLWFTFLFKRPELFRSVATFADPFARELRLFGAGLDAAPPRLADMPFLVGRAARAALRGNNHLGAGRGKWPFGRLSRFAAHAVSGYPKADAFKEPNASIFLRQLASYFPNMKYVHVARHGLDMALSDNQQMFHNWSRLYGLAPERDASPRQILKFWVGLNDEVVEFARDQLGPDRFFFARYDDFVEAPRAFAETYLSFIGGKGDAEAVSAIAALARRPASFRRFLEVAPSMFDAADIGAVMRHGFDVPASWRRESESVAA